MSKYGVFYIGVTINIYSTIFKKNIILSKFIISKKTFSYYKYLLLFM